MAIIARSLDDLILDRMVTALTDFSDQQSAIDPHVKFFVVRDQLRPPSENKMPFVNIWLDTLDTQNGGTSARLNQQELARINIDCYAKTIEFEENEEFDADITAMSRLAYLKEQVKYGLYKLVNADFGFQPGIIGRKKWPNWRLFQTDMKMPELEVVAGRWTIEVEYSWNPEDIESIALDSIAVDAGLWEALYEY